MEQIPAFEVFKIKLFDLKTCFFFSAKFDFGVLHAVCFFSAGVIFCVCDSPIERVTGTADVED